MKLKWYVVGLVLALFCINMNVQAADNGTEIIPVSPTIYFTNSDALIFEAPSVYATVVSDKNITQDNIPVQVTGITTSGFYQVLIDRIYYYIPGNGLYKENSLYGKEKQIYNSLMSMRNQYHEGLNWSNENYYKWNGGVYSGGYGCAAFAFLLSDNAFGDAPARIHYDYSNIRVGDILRIYHNTHTVIVLEVKNDSVIVAEGNYNYSIHWGREIPKSQLQDESSYIMTRY